MKCLIAVSLLIVGCIAQKDLTLPAKWALFKEKHMKSYDDKATEQYRYQLWLENLKFIEAHNARYEAGKTSYAVAQNYLSDLTMAERGQRLGLFKGSANRTPANSTYAYEATSTKPIPESIDWRKKGAVTRVKNQGGCMTCWTFSSTAALEGQLYRTTGKLISLSEQELYDCIPEANCMSGGLMDWSFQFLQNHGLESEADYPYLEHDQPCKLDETKTVLKKISSYKDIAQGDEEALTQAIAEIGPISVAIDANNEGFQFYSHGVFDSDVCGNKRTDLDHGVAAVGYGTNDQGKQYYIVKNSWDVTWGMDGYILMSRNKDNQCGIATAASYPVI